MLASDAPVCVTLTSTVASAMTKPAAGTVMLRESMDVGVVVRAMLMESCAALATPGSSKISLAATASAGSTTAALPVALPSIVTTLTPKK